MQGKRGTDLVVDVRLEKGSEGGVEAALQQHLMNFFSMGHFFSWRPEGRIPAIFNRVTLGFSV